MLYNVIFLESSIFFSVTITMTMSSDMTDVLQCNHDVTLTLTLDPSIEKKGNLNKKASI